MTPQEVWGVVQTIGNPVLIAIFGIVIVASLVSERVEKMLGPFGKIARWWKTRQQRAEEDAQAVYRARRASLEEVAGDRLEYLTATIDRMEVVMRRLEAENEGLRDKLTRALTELTVVHRTLEAQSKDVQSIKRTIDTGERLALPPPPPTGATRRHAAPDTDPQTQRIPPAI